MQSTRHCVSVSFEHRWTAPSMRIVISHSSHRRVQIKLPIYHIVLRVPAWSVALAVLWPVMFFSFMLHSFAVGGDAFNGKVEDGRYFLWKRSQSRTDAAPYVEVSKARYRASYIHGLATMIFIIPAGIGICRIV